MAKHKRTYAILGLSQFGFRMAVALYEAGQDIIAIDREEKIVQKIARKATTAITADLTDWEVLEHAGVFEVDVAVITLRSSFDIGILLAHKLRQQEKIETIIAQADTDEKAEALKVMGADIVVFPEKDIADRLVKRLMTPNFIEHVPLSPDVSVMEVGAPDIFSGKSLVDLHLRAEYEVHIIGIRHPPGVEGGGKMLIAPSPLEKFRHGDVMLVLGNIDKLEDFVEEMSKKSKEKPPHKELEEAEEKQRAVEQGTEKEDEESKTAEEAGEQTINTELHREDKKGEA